MKIPSTFPSRINFFLGAITIGLISGLQGVSEIIPSQSRAETSVPQGINASDWTGILAAHDSAQRRIESQGDGFFYATRNARQQWRVRFDERGFMIRPDAGGWEWGLELHRYGYGVDGDTSAPKKISATAENDQLVYHRDDNLSEWYINRSEGLLHGWTLAKRPYGNANDKPLELILAVRGSLQPQLEREGAVVFNDAKGRKVLNYSELKAWDADGQLLPVHFVISNRNLIVRVDDRAARYPVTIDPIAQQAYLKASNTDTNDQFGFSVAVSGSTVVVGAYTEDSNATGVNGNQSDNSASDSGAAYVFARINGVWIQQAYLKASNTDASDHFGFSVAISKNTIVVGANAEDSDATGVNGNQHNHASDTGAAYVFVRNATGVWTQQAYLKASNTGNFDAFGESVAIWGDTIVIGAHGEDSDAIGINGNQNNNNLDDSGAAYVFVRNAVGQWSQEAYLKASNTGVEDAFGYSVAISADTVVIGAIMENSNATGVNGNQNNDNIPWSGAAYVFIRINGVWTQQAYLKASNTGTQDYFGNSVAISGNTIVVGAFGEKSAATGVNGNELDNNALWSGAAYVFERTNGTWAQQAYLKASNTEENDYFGCSVAVAGNTIVVGAYNESSSAIGVNGNQNNNNAGGSGAVYVFGKSNTPTTSPWLQQAYLKASNTGQGDNFGISVAISGSIIVVGAHGESSNATGVNGNQNNNSADQSGATYVFGL